MTTEKFNKSVYLTALCFGLGMTTGVIIVAMAGLIGLDLAPHPALATLPFGFQYVGMMMSAFASSMLQSKFGRKKIIILACLLGALTGVINIVAAEQKLFWLLCTGHFIFGIFIANVALLRFAVLDLTPKSLHSKALSMVLFGGTFAALIGPTMSRNMPKLLDSLNFNLTMYQASYFSVSLLAVVVIGILSVIKFPKIEQKKTAAAPIPVKKLLTSEVYLFALLCGGVGYALMKLIMINASIQMKMNGFDFSAVSYYIQIHVFAMYFPSLFNSKILAKIGVKNFLLIGLVLQLLVSVTFIFGQNAWTFLISLFILGVSWNILYTASSYIVGHTFSDENEKFKAQGIQDLFIFFMSAVGALTAGAILNAMGWNNQHVMAIVVTMVLVAAFYRVYTKLTDINAVK